jgi:hypothetical protein
VDWVTEAGAGGRVVSLMESIYDSQEDAVNDVLSAMTDEEFADHLREHRPALAEALVGEPNGENEGGQVAEGNETETPKPEEVLREALESDEGRSMVAALIRPQVEQMAGEMFESLLDEEREIIRAEASADANRRVQLRDLRETAHKLIDQARLPDAFAEQSKAKFDLSESGEPTAPLNVIPEINDDGEVLKTAEEKLTEAVTAEIASQRELVATLRPTRVTGQGGKPSKGDGGEGEKVEESRPKLPAKTGELLTEAGFNDPDKVYVNG